MYDIFLGWWVFQGGCQKISICLHSFLSICQIIVWNSAQTFEEEINLNFFRGVKKFFGGGNFTPLFFLHQSFIQGQTMLHPEFLFPRSSGSALKVCSMLVILETITLSSRSCIQTRTQFNTWTLLPSIWNFWLSPFAWELQLYKSLAGFKKKCT